MVLRVRLSCGQKSSRPGSYEIDKLTQSSFSDEPASSNSCRCFSTISSSHLKSRTTNLDVSGKICIEEIGFGFGPHSCKCVQGETHLFSRHFCMNSSLTFLNNVTLNSAYSSSAANLLCKLENRYGRYEFPKQGDARKNYAQPTRRFHLP